jgi:hypothetical protein
MSAGFELQTQSAEELRAQAARPRRVRGAGALRRARKGTPAQRAARAAQAGAAGESGAGGAPVSALNPRTAAKFLEHLRRTGKVDVAADLTGMHRTTFYYHRQRDPDFAHAWNVAVHVYRVHNQKRVLRRRARAEEESDL